MKKNSNTETRGPGRPQYTPTIPRGKFTFSDLMEANGVNPNTGKGKLCTKLTLNKWIKRDLWITDKKGNIIRGNPNSTIVRLKDIMAEPDSKSGLGRKQYVYLLRSKLNGKETAKAPAAPKATRKARKASEPVADVAVNVGTDSQTPTADALDKIHAALAAPTPAVTITPDPVADAPVEAPEPETEAPTAEATAAETASVSAEATAAVS